MIRFANPLPRASGNRFPIRALEFGVVKMLLKVLGDDIHDVFHAPPFVLVVSLHVGNSTNPPDDRQSYKRNQCLPYEEALLEHDFLPQWKPFIMPPVSSVEQRKRFEPEGIEEP